MIININVSDLKGESTVTLFIADLLGKTWNVNIHSIT